MPGMHCDRCALAVVAAVFLAAGAHFQNAAHAAQVTLNAVKDNTLFEWPEGGQFSNGAGEYFFAGRNNQDQPFSIRRGLIAFDVAGSIPAGSTITGVTLTLYMSRTTAPATNVTLHRLSSDWGEGASDAGGQEGLGAASEPGDATWEHTFYDTQFWTTPGGDFLGAVSATTSVGGNGFYSWTGAGLVADVQYWLDNPGSDFGWLVKGDESAPHLAKRFNSRTSGTVSRRPALVINYNAPVIQGACCLMDDSCVVLTPANCSGQGGMYQGDGTTCTPDPCVPPTGACCFDDTTCQVLTSIDCAAMGGSYQGDGGSCTIDLCPLVLEPYVDALPIPMVRTPDSIEPGNIPRHDIEILEFNQQLHRDLPATRLWGYDGLYPGKTLEADSGQPIQVNWINNIRDEMGVLRTQHLLPVDLCLHGPDTEGDSPRVVTHLHGGHVPADVDGYPEDTILPGESVLYEYPNNQPAATMWYHDHALGITRLNVMLGLAGFYIIHDANEASLNLPAGPYDVPIAMQDRSFHPDGSLDYPAAWEEHFFGEFMLANGKVWPYFNVDQGKYRLRLLNGCNARTLTLALSNNDNFTLIGVDGGLLETPTVMNSVTLGPAERADIIVDFSVYGPGTEIILENSAPAPYPGAPGIGVIPNVMKFIVGSNPGDTDPVPVNLRTIETLDENDASQTRDFVMKKVSDPCTGSVWLINGMHWDHITEHVTLGDTEIWRFVNQSGMMHPMHMHLVFFQVLDRQPVQFTGDEWSPSGPATPPTASEMGWKDTVQVGPFEAVRVIARFEDYTGLYPYHCHILEHEDHDMMRQYMVRLPCPADLTNAMGMGPDGVVDVYDLFRLLANWNTAGSGAGLAPPTNIVDVADLFILLSQWGQCP